MILPATGSDVMCPYRGLKNGGGRRVGKYARRRRDGRSCEIVPSLPSGGAVVNGAASKGVSAAPPPPEASRPAQQDPTVAGRRRRACGATGGISATAFHVGSSYFPAQKSAGPRLWTE